MTKWLLMLSVLTSFQVFSKDNIRLVGVEKGTGAPCSLILVGDYEEDDETVTLNNAFIENRFTPNGPIQFTAIIGKGNGHNWFVSIGHRVLQINVDPTKNLELLSYTFNPMQGHSLECDLSNAEVIADF